MIKKTSFDSHSNRKSSCEHGTKSKNIKKIVITCKQCKNTFSRKDSLDRHLPICKIGNINGNNNVVQGKNNNNVQGENNIIVSGDINIKSVYIILVNHGKDGTDCLSRKELGEIYKPENKTNLIENLLLKVNFDPNKPEHHNIYYSDIKSSYGEVYEDKKWNTKKINEILNTIVDAKREDLNKILQELGDVLSKKTKNKIKETIENTDYSKAESRKMLLTYLKPILYNNKDVITKIRKLSENNSKKIVDIDTDND